MWEITSSLLTGVFLTFLCLRFVFSNVRSRIAGLRHQKETFLYVSNFAQVTMSWVGRCVMISKY